jgi:glycosyltransferase involved in cell wall biosynthesis
MRQSLSGLHDGGTLAGRTVLPISPSLDAGGAERTTIDIAAALAAVGARSLVASTGGRLVSELQAKGGVLLPFPANTKNPAAMALNVARLARLIRSEGVDILHARSRAPAWVALGAAKLTGTPLVTTYHGAYGGRSQLKILYNSVMARGRAVIANSQYTASLIADMHAFAGPRVRVIHRGTDFRVFSPAAVEAGRIQKLRAAWGVAPDDRVILVAARLTAWKGHRDMIEAAALLRERGLTDVRVIFAGDPQGRDGYIRDLDDMISKAGLTGIVKRVGHCADMPAAFLAASVVAVPSTQPEAFGRSAVEAQAMGTPVVVTDLGAVPETVLAPPEVGPQARTGWRVPPQDPKALAAALQEALGLGASARDALAQRARAHVTANFSLERMCRETLDIYTALLEGRA